MRADQRRYHYIYKITRWDGKFYVGMHSTDDLEDGYFGSGKIITRSIKKHGKEKHSKEILEHLPSRALLREREREIVNEKMVGNVLCMNLQLGGGGGFINEEHQLKAASVGGKVSGPEVVKTMLTAEAKAKSLATRHSRKSFNPVPANKASTLPENIAKRKSTFAERGHSQGEKNSQFGTCWVTDGQTTIKVKKEQLDEYLAKGYSRGRSQFSR